jgi:pterin-4a-carbinolamine dehydratase
VTHIERTFAFPSFREAVNFMAEMAMYCHQPEVNRHPNWRNVRQTAIVTLSVWTLSIWDIGSQSAALDIGMANTFNDVYTARSPNNSSKDNG